MRKVKCSNPSRDRPKTYMYNQKKRQLHAWQQECISWFLEDDHYKRMPNVKVGMARWKKTLLLNCYEGWAQVKIFSPSPAMLTFPYGWKILAWDENPKQTNKQTKILLFHFSL